MMPCVSFQGTKNYILVYSIYLHVCISTAEVVPASQTSNSNNQLAMNFKHNLKPASRRPDLIMFISR